MYLSQTSRHQGPELNATFGKLIEIKRVEMKILVMIKKDNWPNSINFFGRKSC